jgi:hypothetical protein
MLEVEFSQLAATPTALRVGVVIRYGQDGPIRFATLVIPDDALDWHALADVTAWLNRQVSRHLDREREPADDQALPGL